MYKSELKEIFFLNLQQMVKVIKPSCWDQNFDPEALSAPAQRLYTHENT